MELKTHGETSQRVDPFLHQTTNNNREAVDELFARYRGRLYKTAFRILGNSHDAEDALQDGLLSAFRNLGGFRGHSQFSTWLTRIVVNAALMQLRRRRPEVTTSINQKLDRDDQPLANRIPDHGPNPEDMYARQEQLQILEGMLQSMPRAYRLALWLCHVQGMSTREAAEALGVPIGTLKSQLHRARLRLGEEVAELRPAQRVLQGRRADAAITRHWPNLELTEKVTQRVHDFAAY